MPGSSQPSEMQTHAHQCQLHLRLRHSIRCASMGVKRTVPKAVPQSHWTGQRDPSTEHHSERALLQVTRNFNGALAAASLKPCTRLKPTSPRLAGRSPTLDSGGNNDVSSTTVASRD